MLALCSKLHCNMSPDRCAAGHAWCKHSLTVTIIDVIESINTNYPILNGNFLNIIRFNQNVLHMVLCNHTGTMENPGSYQWVWVPGFSKVVALFQSGNYINPGYGLSLVDTLWNASSYRQPLEQEGDPMTWIEKFWLQISLIVAKK